jgi:hypothetical protein
VRSVADQLRREAAARVRELSPAQRVELALGLGEEDLELFRVAHGLSRAEALRELRRRRQAGRVPCSCFESVP